MKVNECMCQDVCFVKPDCKVYDAARIMNENHIGCVPVCNDQKNIVGLVTDRDIVLRTVACDKNAKTTQVSEIMTTNVYTCRCGEDLVHAQNVMAQNQIRRVPVVDNQNKMVGIITMGDLANKSQNVGEEQFSSTVKNICQCQGKIKNYC